MKKYDSYKDSGIEWIGEIPFSWNVKKLKFIGNAIGGLTYSPNDVVEDESNGVLVLRSSNIQKGKLSLEDNVYVNLEISEKQTLRKGDILICSRNGSQHLIGKNICIDERTEGNTFGAFMMIFRSDNYHFLNHFFNSPIFTSQSGLFLTATINQLTSSTLNNFYLALPSSIEEQTTIANYLDQKTSQIDDLIAKKERMIQLMEEERTAIINQAVTKGLDPTVPMKASGIEWLGEIPAHWEVKQVRYLLLTGNEGIKIGPFGSALKLEFMVSEGYKIYGQENVIKDDFSLGYKFINEEKYQELLNYKISSGDIVITMMGTAGLAKVVPKNIQEGIMDSHLTRIRVDEDKLLNRLFELLLNDSYLIKSQVQFHSKGAIMGGLNSTIIKSFVLPVAPIDEQEEILSFIESKLNSLVKTNMHIKREIELLREYKTALISEVVTGKVDVRNEKLN